MQGMRLFFCLLLVAALAVNLPLYAGESASDPTQADPQEPGGTAQQTGPENPLEETQRRTESEAGKPKAPAFDVGTAAGTARDQMLGEIRLQTGWTDLGGAEDRSFRVEGVNNLAEFNYYMDQGLTGTRRMQVLSMYRGTDDRSIDPEHNSLQKAYLRLYGPQDEYVFGDNLVNYSRLTFNQNIRGVSVMRKLNGDWKLFANGGVFTDRWGSLYRDADVLPTKPYTAVVTGTRLERGFGGDSALGFNFSASNDLVDSLPETLPGTPPLPATNFVTSLDGRWQGRGYRLQGELGYSVSDFDKRVDCQNTVLKDCPDSRLPQPDLGYQGDWGLRLDGTYRTGRWNLRGSFVRYQPNFASLNARQIADLQDWVGRAGYDLTNWLNVQGTLRRSNNNLKEQLGFGTVLWGPEARFLLHNLSFYRRAQIEFGYRHRSVKASDDSIDRDVRMPFVELTLPFQNTFFSLGYERREAIDRTDASRSSNTDRFYGSLRGMFDLAGWFINPVGRFEVERQSHRPRFTPSVNLADCLLDPVLCQLDRDSNRFFSASAYIEAPKWFILEGSYRESNATLFGPSGFSRPSFRAAVTYKYRNDLNRLLILSYYEGRNFYFTSPDFDEKQFAATVVFKFGNRTQ